MNHGLQWYPLAGIGYLKVPAGIALYDQKYFEKFARQADSEIGRALMLARVGLVDRFWRGEVIDVGIGSGAFIEARRALVQSRPDRYPNKARDGVTFGYDVNPAGLAWLHARELYCDPYRPRVRAITLWDVLEHIPDFPALLVNVTDWVFTSLPIFTDANHVLRSKHFKPVEHCWYFTAAGLIGIMGKLGFECEYRSNVESRLGREDIESFAFRRVRREG